MRRGHLLSLAVGLALSVPVPPVAARQAGADPDALWAAGQRVAALEAWSAQLDARPGDEALRRLLAERQMEAQRFAAALATAAPLGPELDGLRGRALYVLARYDEALKLLSPDDPEQVLLVVDALGALGRRDEERAALDRAAALLGADHERVLALRGRDLAVQGRHAEAVELFRSALARDPLDREALYGLGAALVRSGRREEGLAALEHHRAILPLLDRRDFAVQSLALDPGHADSLAQLGDVERELGLIDSAEQRYRAALARADATSLPPVALRLARLLVEDRDDVEAAVALLDEAAGRVADARLPVRAGDVLAASGRGAEALERYERALELRPDDAQIRARRDGAAAALGPPAAGAEPQR